MADRSTRSSKRNSSRHRRRARGQAENNASAASRNPSARPSVRHHHHDETPRHQPSHPSQPSQPPPGYAPSIRSTTSRFSQTDQFAATRREFEFDFDDASSIARSTVVSQPLNEVDSDDDNDDSNDAHDDDDNDDNDNDDDDDDENLTTARPATTSRPENMSNYYDLLCVSRDPSPDSIRRAYFRLLTLLYPEVQPPHLRQASGVYFTVIQNAFETLLDPCRRLKYDLDLLHSASSHAASHVNAQNDEDYRLWHTDFMRNREQQENADAGLDFWELGARFDAQELSNHLKYGRQDGTSTVEPVDFEMGHSFSLDLPGLDRQVRQATRVVQAYLDTRFMSQKAVGEKQPDYVAIQNDPSSDRKGGTVLAIRGSVYGFLPNVSFLPVTTLLDPYQPSLSTTLTKDRLVQLHAGKIHPLIAIKLRHDISRGNLASKAGRSTKVGNTDQDETVIEAETEVLPEPSVSIGLSRHMTLPYDRNVRSLVQVGVKSSLNSRRLPRFWSSVRRPTAEGVLLCSIDSGDWQMRPDETCRVLSDFTARVKRKLLYFDLPLYRTPKLEIAYKAGGPLDPRGTLITDRLSDRGLRGLDKGFYDDGTASWTVSATAESTYLSTSLKYARDVSFELPHAAQNKHAVAHRGRWGLSPAREVRIEAEFSANSVWAGYLAVRCLKRVGRFAKFGFELGLSSYSLHLSVYWSRLGRRVNLPFLMCSRENLNTSVLFWTTIVPFTSFAAWEAWSRYRRLRQYRLREEKVKSSLQEDQGYKRVEADQVASLMMTGVQNKQRAEYTVSGLVIKSAKYGVKAPGSSNAWGAEEVADVTVPVAALVNGSRLFIPAGVCKSNILGFWDPSPGEEKVLHVRYMYKGKEATVEVSGDDEELVLPPSRAP
ncbi:hypothetical protein F4775DRAFT_540699 [Biscogniauxia sp. FL1348]|nr:hypothetical protein F4775DRAFT_540699 [Biscogniauxia sp. FL1348]